jgi:hypothetical protein
MMPRKDGIDRYPRVDADSWQEALALATPGTEFRCPDGITITFGTQTIKGIYPKPARP